MGRTWIGFQPVVKPAAGTVMVEEGRFAAGLHDPEIVALLTTARGLAQWLAPTTAFSDRRGGNIDFIAADGSFTGSYSLIEVPAHVVLVTDRHGEIDVRVDVRTSPTTVHVSIRCFVPDGADTEAARARSREVIDAIGRCISGGRETE